MLICLNDGPQATPDELKSSYRRLCMLYHPDKHRDPELKRQAEHLFNYVHQAYEGIHYNPFLMIVLYTRIKGRLM